MTGQQGSFDELMAEVNDGSGDWLPQYLRAVESITPGTRFQSYDIELMFQRALGDPPHKQAGWGAAIKEAERRLLVQQVPDIAVKSKRPTTKGSLVHLWERTTKRSAVAA